MASSEIDISKLSVEQLEGLRRQTETEIKNLNMSLSSLREAQARFLESAASLSAIPADGEGRDALIPLTQALFVPGQLGGPEEVLVDIGTGYFVGKPLPAAVELLRKRADAVGGEVGGLARVVSVKQGNLEVITQHLQFASEARGEALAQQRAAGGGGGGAPSAAAAAAAAADAAAAATPSA